MRRPHFEWVVSLQTRLILASVAIVVMAIFITSGVFVIRDRESQRTETLQKIASATVGFSVSNVTPFSTIQSSDVSVGRPEGGPGVPVPILPYANDGGATVLSGNDAIRPSSQAVTIETRESGSVPDYRILIVNKDGEVVQDPTGKLAGVKLSFPADDSVETPSKKGYITWPGGANPATAGLTFLAPTNLEAVNKDGLMVVAAIDSTSLTADWLAMGPELALSALVLLPLAMLAVVLVTRRITLPLRHLTVAVDGMSRGDFDQRVEVSGHDEVATLAASFTVMAGRVKERDTQLRNLIANVSHDLRTPLTSIQGYAEALADGVAKPTDVERAAGIIRDEARHASSLLANLLGLSEIESGEVVVRQVEFDINQIVERCIRRLEPRARELDIVISLSGTATPLLVGDPEKVERAVCNIVENAVKFARSRIEVQVTQAGGDVTVLVGNDGPAIPAEDAGRIFDRFYRSSGPNAGSGLGLAIARELMELNGGRVELLTVAPVLFGIRLPLPLPVSKKASNP